MFVVTQQRLGYMNVFILRMKSQGTLFDVPPCLYSEQKICSVNNLTSVPISISLCRTGGLKVSHIFKMRGRLHKVFLTRPLLFSKPQTALHLIPADPKNSCALALNCDHTDDNLNALMLTFAMFTS